MELRSPGPERIVGEVYRKDATSDVQRFMGDGPPVARQTPHGWRRQGVVAEHARVDLDARPDARGVRPGRGGRARDPRMNGRNSPMTAVHEPMVGRYVYVPYAGYDYRVYYEEAGLGIPLVCLHTAGTDAREWRHQLADPEITDGFQVIAFDMPSHGKSIPPNGFEKEEYRLTAKFYSEFVMAFCKVLELDQPVIMGSSMGGNICLHLAADFEDRVRALIAIEACDYSPGWYINWLAHPHVHGGEACAT